jgi:hypothetical protein
MAQELSKNGTMALLGEDDTPGGIRFKPKQGHGQTSIRRTLKYVLERLVIPAEPVHVNDEDVRRNLIIKVKEMIPDHSRVEVIPCDLAANTGRQGEPPLNELRPWELRRCCAPGRVSQPILEGPGEGPCFLETVHRNFGEGPHDHGVERLADRWSKGTRVCWIFR